MVKRKVANTTYKIPCPSGFVELKEVQEPALYSLLSAPYTQNSQQLVGLFVTIEDLKSIEAGKQPTISSYAVATIHDDMVRRTVPLQEFTKLKQNFKQDISQLVDIEASLNIDQTTQTIEREAKRYMRNESLKMKSNLQSLGIFDESPHHLSTIIRTGESWSTESEDFNQDGISAFTMLNIAERCIFLNLIQSQGRTSDVDSLKRSTREWIKAIEDIKNK